MARLYILLFLVQIFLAVIALISCISADPDRIRGLPRAAWVVIILLFPLVGSITWFLAGRPATAGRSGSGTWLTGGPRHTSHRPVAPDDDPDFLRSISERIQSDRSRGWDTDPHHREDEHRRRDDNPPREDLG